MARLEIPLRIANSITFRCGSGATGRAGGVSPLSDLLGERGASAPCPISWASGGRQPPVRSPGRAGGVSPLSDLLGERGASAPCPISWASGLAGVKRYAQAGFQGGDLR